MERLRLKSIPVIGIVANEKIKDYIRLSDKLENGVQALEDIIEQRLFEAGAIEKVRSNGKDKRLNWKDLSNNKTLFIKDVFDE